MSIQPLKIEETKGAVNETLNAINSKLGMVPNLFAVFAKAPAVLNSYLALSENLKAGTLDTKIAEQVALAIAVKNSCGYCLSAHTTIGKGAGLSEKELENAPHGKSDDAKAQAAISLALEVNESKGHGNPEAVAKAKQAGLTEQEILEVVAHTALNILTNSVNGLANTVIDFPKVELPEACSTAKNSCSA